MENENKRTAITSGQTSTAATNPRLKGVIIDFNEKQGLGKIMAEDEEFYFFNRHQMLLGRPKEGVTVTFLVSPKPVREGFLRYAMLIKVTVDTEAGQVALATPVGADDGKAVDAKVGE